MVTLKPEFLLKNGKKEFVVLSYEEFCSLQEYLADIEDLLDLRKAKKQEADKPSVSLKVAKKELNL